MNALLLQALLMTAAPDAAPADPAPLLLTHDAAPAHPTWGGTATALAGYPDGVGARLGGWWRLLALEGSVGTFGLGETASAHVGVRGVLSDARTAANEGWTWTGAALLGVHYVREENFLSSVGWTVWGPEVAGRLEATRWTGAFGLIGALQVGVNHLYGREYFSKWAVLPTVSLELGAAF